MPELDMITGQEQVPPLRPPAPAPSMWTELMDQVTPMERPSGAAPTDQMTGVDELTGRPVFQSTVGQRYTFIDQEQTDQNPSLAAAKENWTDMISYLETTSTPELFKEIGSGALEIILEAYNALERVTRGEGNAGDVLTAAGFAFGAGSAAPAPRGALRIFAGPRSQDPRFENDKLDEMTASYEANKAAGMSEENTMARVYEQYGVFILPDEQARVEIPDFNAELTPTFHTFNDRIQTANAWETQAMNSVIIDPTDPNRSYNIREIRTLGDILDHPELYTAYPELKAFPVELYFDDGSATMGTAHADRLSINVASGPNETRSTLIHEIQHWVQEREGMDRGSNPDHWEKLIRHPMPMAEYDAVIRDWKMHLSGMRIYKGNLAKSEKDLARYRAEWHATKDPAERTHLREMIRLELSSGHSLRSTIDSKGARGAYTFRDVIERRIVNEYVFGNFATLGKTIPERAYEIYRNTMGEVEARYVQMRDRMARRAGASPEGPDNPPAQRAALHGVMENPSQSSWWEDAHRNLSIESIEKWIEMGLDPSSVPLSKLGLGPIEKWIDMGNTLSVGSNPTGATP